MADRQVACPHCFQMNHYNATKCAYCLGTTWRHVDRSSESGGSGLLVLLFVALIVWALSRDNEEPAEAVETVIQNELTVPESDSNI
jgi:hypothetical protein